MRSWNPVCVLRITSKTGNVSAWNNRMQKFLLIMNDTESFKIVWTSIFSRIRHGRAVLLNLKYSHIELLKSGSEVCFVSLIILRFRRPGRNLVPLMLFRQFYFFSCERPYRNYFSMWILVSEWSWVALFFIGIFYYFWYYFRHRFISVIAFFIQIIFVFLLVGAWWLCFCRRKLSLCCVLQERKNRGKISTFTNSVFIWIGVLTSTTTFQPWNASRWQSYTYR